MSTSNPGKLGAGFQHGFTLTELITIMVILGILAAVAAPRFFDRGSFDSRGFYDQTISTLRYAQKTAIAQRRFVCVALTGSSLTLTIDPTAPGAAHTAATCPGNALTSPEGNSPFVLTAPSGVTLAYTPVITGLSFDALGRSSLAAQQKITVSGYGDIFVEMETGYVH